MTGYIEVETFYDKDGNRTCAVDFNAGIVCKFYRTQRFGTYETCIFAPNANKYADQLLRRGDDGTGSLIPGNWCPIKEKLNEQKR